MSNFELIYQYLKDLSKESVELFDDLNKYETISRPYLSSVIETFLTVFLLGSPNQSEEEITQNRMFLLKAMERCTRNYKKIVMDYCQTNLDKIKDADKLSPQIKQLKATLTEIYSQVSSK